MSLPDAIHLLEQLVEELGGRDALSLDGNQTRSTGDAMAALFEEDVEEDGSQGPFLGEGDDRDDAVAGASEHPRSSKEEALLAGASVDDSVDFWSELDDGNRLDAHQPVEPATKEKAESSDSKKD